MFLLDNVTIQRQWQVYTNLCVILNYIEYNSLNFDNFHIYSQTLPVDTCRFVSYHVKQLWYVQQSFYLYIYRLLHESTFYSAFRIQHQNPVFEIEVGAKVEHVMSW